MYQQTEKKKITTNSKEKKITTQGKLEK